jgi:hypothetical protein
MRCCGDGFEGNVEAIELSEDAIGLARLWRV